MRIIIWNEWYCPVQNHILKRENTFGKFLTNFHIFKNTFIRIAFENAYELFINFQPFLYAYVPAESPSYVPTFFGCVCLENVCIHYCVLNRSDLLNTNCLTSISRILHSYGDVSITGEDLQISARVVFKRGVIFIVSHPLWHMVLTFESHPIDRLVW